MSAGQVAAGAAAALASVALLELVHDRRLRPDSLRAAAMRALRHLGRRANVPAPRDLAGRLEAAGARATAADVMAVKTGAALAAAAAGALALGPPMAALALPAFLAPDLALHARVRRRARAMEQELPDILDLLRVCVTAGLSPWRAVQEVGRRHTGLLGAELARAASQVALGLPRAEAMRNLARRAPARGIPSLVVAFERSQLHGAPLAPTLAAQAVEARSLRVQQTHERAARAAPKIQLVVALLLVPSVLLLVAATLIPAALPVR